MTCSRCSKGFLEGDLIQATVLSVYHVIEKPNMDQFRFAIERPHAATNIQHLVCESE
jgi:hypothetical protein